MNPSTRTSVATQSGAIVGGSLGAALGDQFGGYNGSFWGSMIGSVAGVAVGAAASSSYNKQANKRFSQIERQPIPSLVIRDIILRDKNGDKCINSNEHCQIIFIIENNGEGSAENVTPRIKQIGNAKKIQLSSPKSIHRITKEDKISYTIQAFGTEKLKSGFAEFEITLQDANKNVLCKESFTVKTLGLKN